MPLTEAAWKNRPEAQDFPNAGSYLSLIFPRGEVVRLVKALQHAKVLEHAGKDILRASRLPLLSRDDPHVIANLKKITKGKTLSPVLLVRGDGGRDLPLIVADGYHRICAAYYHNYDEPVPCCLVSRPKD
jgi:hypothetical protein